MCDRATETLKKLARWHMDEDKRLSRLPNNPDRARQRAQHQEQMQIVGDALSDMAALPVVEQEDGQMLMLI